MPSNISLLRTFLRVQESSLHGKGVFANRDIKEGTLMGVFRGRVLQNPQDYTHILTIEDDQNLLVRNRLKYLNHNKEPNAEIDGELGVYALRNISAGEEVTIDYGPDWH
jgi:uncharacterized protein